MILSKPNSLPRAPAPNTITLGVGLQCMPVGRTPSIRFQLIILSTSHTAHAQSCLTVTRWNTPRQAPLSLRLSRQEYRNGLPFPSPGDLPVPGIKPTSACIAGRCFTTELPGKPFLILLLLIWRDVKLEEDSNT